jgi:vitamin B12 transporter
VKRTGLALIVLALIPGMSAAAGDGERSLQELYFPDDVMVESATRSPKPISQVPENVTVVTEAEIRAMNAHTLAEVLNRVTGVFAQFFGFHFGANALAHIQGSGETQWFLNGSADLNVTVLVDGMPWNSMNAGPILATIPVGVIDRIEVVKGPASSVWGSSLGGVIHVFTKPVGTTAVPRGEVAGSYGERDTYDGRAEVAGAAGPVGYYLQGQAQHADWDDRDADFENRSAFGKAAASLPGGASLVLSGGYSDPKHDLGRFPSQFAIARQEAEAAFGRVAVDAPVGRTVTLHAAAYRYDERIDQPIQEDGTFAPEGDLLRDTTSDQEMWGAQARATWVGGRHAIVLGADYRRGEVTQTVDSGEFFVDVLGAPARVRVTPSLDTWGFYANDSISVGPVTLVPGLRFDDTTETDPFWSPSLGATWRVARGTLLRASVARGFTAPSLVAMKGGGLFLDPNPDLDPERVWSYQAGVETSAVPFLWLKLSGFHHDVSDLFDGGAPSPTTPGNNITVNRGSVSRTGFEAEAATASFRGFSTRGGFAYVHVSRSGDDREQDQYEANLGLFYDGFLQANLLGHFVWWDLGPGAEEGKYNDPLWDLNLSKTFSLLGSFEGDLFATVHNLFAGEQEIDQDQGTEPRWFEGGIRLRF